MRGKECEAGTRNMRRVQEMQEEYEEFFSFLVPSHFSYQHEPWSHSLYPHHIPCIKLTFSLPLNFFKFLIVKIFYFFNIIFTLVDDNIV